MIHAYAYNADDTPLREAGAEKIWYDPKGIRDARVRMLTAGALRDGDTLLLLSLYNLAGSPTAFDRWRKEMQALSDRGITPRIVETDSPPRPVGRPKVYDPSAAQMRKHWAIWTDGHPLGKDRLAAIEADYGAAVTRQTLNGRYGNPTRPKPAPTEEPS